MAITNQSDINQLEKHIIGTRFIFESYRISYAANEQVGSQTQALALLLATTFLRALIIELCVIFHRIDEEPVHKNFSLSKLLNRIFTTSKDKRPDLTQLLSESIGIMKEKKLYDLRNKKIAHLDLTEITPSMNDPDIYEKLVGNAEIIISAIIDENELIAERAKPDFVTEPALVQLRDALTLTNH